MRRAHRRKPKNIDDYLASVPGTKTQIDHMNHQHFIDLNSKLNRISGKRYKSHKK